MKIPHLRVLAVTAASLATAATVGLSTTAASAAPASTGSRSSTAASPASVGSITSKVTGTFTNSDGTGTFAGTFTPQKFSVVHGVLEATGLLKGTLVDANGTQLGAVSRTITTPVNTPQAANANTTEAANAPAVSCGILDLTLGPLNLNLLGLVVQLNQIHLTITAVPGAGNLLGNLLCAVAGLLNGGGALNGLLGQITALLNSILAAL
jgi:hypothetical protein